MEVLRKSLRFLLEPDANEAQNLAERKLGSVSDQPRTPRLTARRRNCRQKVHDFH
jgi:hypothetical protein